MPNPKETSRALHRLLECLIPRFQSRAVWLQSFRSWQKNFLEMQALEPVEEHRSVRF